MFKWLIRRRGFLAGIAVFLASPIGYITGEKIFTSKDFPSIEEMAIKLGYRMDQSSERITMWNRVTREPSLFLSGALSNYTRRKDNHGNLIWTQDKPNIGPDRGNTHCYVCNKSNILDKNNLVLHMQNRHQLEWKSYYRDLYYSGYIEEV